MKPSAIGSWLSRIAGRICLMLLSLVLALAVAEGALRIVKPELRDLAHSAIQEDSYRINVNPKNMRAEAFHRDTDVKHVMIFNSMGFRQHREISPEKTAGVYRVGLFGDSYAANLRMPSEYSFTEPLDYLLNRAGPKADILNFGTDGYGTDQEYLQYLDEGVNLHLDMVMYLYCDNDLKDVLADHLYELDDAGQLKYLPHRQATLFTRIARRLYLTYFVMTTFADQRTRLRTWLHEEYDPKTLTGHREEITRRGYLNQLSLLNDSPELQKSLRLFLVLIDNWKRETAQRGQDFRVVLLPLSKESNVKMKGILEEHGIQVLDLYPLYEAEAKAGDLSPFFFKKDYHWNEEGNKIAAISLFRYLAPELGIDERSDEFIRRTLSEYYTVFNSDQVSPLWREPVEMTASQQEAIHSRYLALESVLTTKSSFRAYRQHGGHP